MLDCTERLQNGSFDVLAQWLLTESMWLQWGCRDEVGAAIDNFGGSEIDSLYLKGLRNFLSYDGTGQGCVFDRYCNGYGNRGIGLVTYAFIRTEETSMFWRHSHDHNMIAGANMLRAGTNTGDPSRRCQSMMMESRILQEGVSLNCASAQFGLALWHSRKPSQFGGAIEHSRKRKCGKMAVHLLILSHLQGFPKATFHLAFMYW